MSDTDSSEDESVKRLLEATDTQFLSDSLYTKGTKNESQNGTREKVPPSLRNNKDEDEDYNFFRVTPGFRAHVAKKLDERLEQLIKYSDKNGKNNLPKIKCNKTNMGGVKLFRDSTVFVESTEHVEEVNKIEKKYKLPHCGKRKNKEEIIESTEERAKSVAVSPDDVISQRGTEQWTYKTKIVKYKQGPGGILYNVDE